MSKERAVLISGTRKSGRYHVTLTCIQRRGDIPYEDIIATSRKRAEEVYYFSRCAICGKDINRNYEVSRKPEEWEIN